MTSRHHTPIKQRWDVGIVFLLSFILLVIGFLTTGCANFSTQQTFAEIGTLTKQQTNHQLEWGAQPSAQREEMLSQPLALQQAVQLALLNNRDLQASFQQLGVEQAKWVASGIWSNPSLHLSLHTDWPDKRIPPAESEIVVSMNIADLLFQSKQQAVQKHYLGQTVQQIRAEVIGLIGQTERAYHRLETDLYRLEIYRQIVLINEAATDFATSLFQVGNITRLDLLQQTSAYQQAKLSLLAVEDDQRRSREQLSQLMGLWGKDTGWRIQPLNSTLPPIETDIEPSQLAQVESRAVEANIILAIQRQEIDLVRQQLGLVHDRGLLPHVEIGLETASSHTEKKIGPVIGLALPIFNRGQAQKVMLESRGQSLEHSYYQTAVQVRSRARLIKAQLISAKRIVDFYQTQVLPTQNQILDQQQLQYNAMQIGTIRLLETRRQLANHQLDYLQAGYNYLIAASQLRQLLNGRLPSDGDQPPIHNNKIEIKRSSGGH